MDRVAREKLKWRCRRGLLELDLVLERYLAAHPCDAELAELLGLPDNDLWDLINGRREVEERRLQPLVERLRSS